MISVSRFPVVLAAVATLAAGCSGSNGGPSEPSPNAIEGDPVVALETIGSFEDPTSLVPHPDSEHLYVTEQQGRVKRIRVDGGEESVTVLDIADQVRAGEPGTDNETGLFDVEFSPDGRRMYVSYTAEVDDPDSERCCIRRVSEWSMDGHVADPDSQRDLISFERAHPQHQGGEVVFGPDGYLYAGFGDGSPVGDSRNTGQDPSDLDAAIVRIDPAPSGDRAYSIPDDNPFVGREGFAPELWLYGARNPWRFSFDPETGDLWFADVGDTRWEEINYLPASEGAGKGVNLGWSLFEGTHPLGDEDPEPPDDYVAPVFEYPHEGAEACAVIGGGVYRGGAIPALDGWFVFTDFCNGVLRALRLDAMGEPEVRDLRIQVAFPTSFGRDAEGEFYVLDREGNASRLVAAE